MRLKVLHVLNRLAGGGAERLVLDLVNHSDMDIEVSVATVMSGGELAPVFADAGIKVRCANRKRLHPGLSAIRTLRRWCRDVDVVHTHLWGGDFFGGIAARSVGRPLISTVHNTRGDGWLRDWILGHARSADICVGVSPDALSFARSYGVPEERLRCIPNGVDLSRFRKSAWEPGPPWRLLFVGRLTEQKGLDCLIRALVGLNDVQLYVVGDGVDRGKLEDLAASLGVDVVFRGWTMNVAKEYENSHLVVIPSRWEGFGLVAVEAMASGRPVLGTAVGGLEAVLADVGAVVQSDDVDGLRKEIERLIGNTKELEDRAAAGAEYAQKWSIRKTVATYEELYRALAFSPKQP